MSRTRARRPNSEVAARAASPVKVHTKQIKLAPDALKRIAAAKRTAVERFGAALGRVRADLKDFFPTRPTPLPRFVRGRLRNPSLKPARGVLVQVLPPVYGPNEDIGEVPWPEPSTYTDAQGGFTLELPTVPAPDGGLVLRVRGKGATSRVSVRRIDILTQNLGLLDLEIELAALPETENILGNLAIPPAAPGPTTPPAPPPSPVPTLTLGSDDCVRSFQTNAGVIDRFAYSTFIRLVEPALGSRELLYVPRNPNGTRVMAFGFDFDFDFDFPLDSVDWDEVFGMHYEAGEFIFADRKPVSRPIPVHNFQDAVITEPITAVKAGSLGLGYVLKMRQTWVPMGMSLGDLLYSTTLAPGEEQRIAIREQRQTFQVSESETFDLEESQRLQEQLDTSATAVFRDSVDEAADGKTTMNGNGSSWGVGAAGGFVGMAGPVLFGGGAAIGYGQSSGGGDSTSDQHLSRDFVSSASDELHSRLARSASARRAAARTGVKIGTAADDETYTTKIIANRNKCHALTMQYWEVLRHYDVVSEVDDVELVCLVPMELVDFLPPGAPLELPDSDTPPERGDLCERYARVIQYASVIGRAMPRRSELETGLRALSTLSGDPRLTFESKHGPAQDVVDVSVTGTFLANERVSATIVTRTGARIGPFHCMGSISLAFATLEEVRAFRNSPFGFTLRTSIPLPAHIARNQVARFEFSREPLTSVRIGEEDVAIKADDAIGPPRIWDVSCVLQDNQGTFVSAFPGSQSAIRMPMVYAIGADRLPPVFSYADLLHVETLFQHVVRNTAYYSREVWRSLTPEERVILLEPYTIGPPIPTVPSPLDEIPLLNCVTNQVLGFFGNSMILPFHVPPNDVELSTAAIQDALLTFHREGGPAARTSIALPTHGVLGEGILGRCNACEKIDLTRFWNWQDSPIEAADNPVGFPGATLGSKPATAPATLVPQGDITLIQGMTAPDSSTNLAGVLAAAAEPQLTADVTGAAQLADLMATTADQAAATQKAILDASSGFGAKLMAAYPALRQLKGELDKQTNKTDEQKAAEKNAAGVAKLIENVKKLALYVGQGADDNARAERAKEVRKMLGIKPSDLDAMQKADLAQALAPKELDSDDVKNGKKAILEDLSNWS